MSLLQQEEHPPPLQEPQEAERQAPPHPPGLHVWPVVLLPRLASGQEKQVIARLTASSHASDSGERAIANDRAAPPDGQGNAHAHGGSGSGQKTATAHAESDHEKSVTRTMTASHAHDLLTANGKRSESESDGDVHESYPHVT